MSILWIILIVVLVLALLGFVGRGRLLTAPASTGAARGIGRPTAAGWLALGSSGIVEKSKRGEDPDVRTQQNGRNEGTGGNGERARGTPCPRQEVP